MKFNPRFYTPAFLMSMALALAYFQHQKDERCVDFSAFKNLAINIREISQKPLANGPIEQNQTTANIIRTIEKEIASRITSNAHSFKRQIVKKQKINLPILHIAEQVEEINNKELIQLYGINSEKKLFKKFDEIVVDEVKIADSAPAKPTEIVDQKVNEPIETSGPIEPIDQTDFAETENEMPMFEYSRATSEALELQQPYKEKKIFDSALSPTVKEAISRIVGTAPKKALEEAKLDNVDRDTDSGVIYDEVKKSPNPISKEKAKAKTNGFMSEALSKAYHLSAFGMVFSEKEQGQITSFNFTPDYDREGRVDSDAKGVVQLHLPLSEGLNTQTGIVEAQGMLPTRVELNLSTHDQMNVPMISEEDAERLYPGKNLLLLAVDSRLVDIEIDSSFSDRFFIDENWKKVDRLAAARFVLYAGVKSGNILLKYYLTNKETAQKVIYVGEREMYFEEADFINGERELYTFTTRYLMSSKNVDLSIAPDLISVFNTNISSKKRTLNSYELKMPAMVSGSRKYLEMRHLNDSIFVGVDNKFEVDVPSNEFIAKVLEINQINSLKDRCVVQINISKELNNFTVNGKNRSGEMYVETSFLDEAGKFSQTDSELAEKAFIVGDMEGIFGVRLEYSDGSTQFLKTFCSEGTYIVEEL